MLAEYKTKTNVFIGIGLILQIVGPFVADEALLSIIHMVAAVLMIIGCVNYSKGKGHSGAWGLLGLLSIIGLFILVCLSDKHKGK